MKKRIVKCECCGCHFFVSLRFHKLCSTCSEFIVKHDEELGIELLREHKLCADSIIDLYADKCKKYELMLENKNDQLRFAEKTISVLENEIDRLEKLVIHYGGKIR